MPLSRPTFALPATLYDGLPFGRGVIKRYVLAANVDTALVHTLHRVPTLVIPLDNGSTFLPRWKRGVAAWNASSIVIQVDTACPAPGCFFLVI